MTLAPEPQREPCQAAEPQVQPVTTKRARQALTQLYSAVPEEITLEDQAVDPAVGDLNRFISQYTANEMLGMCVDEARALLIQAGVIDETVPPMLLGEAVLSYIAKLKRGEIPESSTDITQ